MGRTINRSSDACKYCLGKFGVDPDPSRPADSDEKLQRRVPKANECRPCFNFLRRGNYGGKPANELIEDLKNDDKRADFLSARADWFKSRCGGKRPGQVQGGAFVWWTDPGDIVLYIKQIQFI